MLITLINSSFVISNRQIEAENQSHKHLKMKIKVKLDPSLKFSLAKNTSQTNPIM